MTTEPESTPHIEVKNVSKHFEGVRALSEVSLSVKQGEIHGLVGENGAGKSTLGRIISGVIPPDDGAIRVHGHSVHYRSPRDALRDRITSIQQEIALVPQRTVLENVFLGFEDSRSGLLDDGSMRRRYRDLDEKSGFGLKPDVRVRRLTIADQQKVEILQALARGAELIVMDEPTAKLNSEESAKLLDIVRDLRFQGTTIIYVSHFLEEVLSVADRVTVMRNGEVVETSPSSEETVDSLVTAMLGRPADLVFPERPALEPAARVVFSARGIARQGILEDVSLELRRGEILGLAGLIGSGQSELARTIFGADSRDAGVLEVDGAPVRMRSTRDAIKAGIHLVPEDRKEQGLLMRLPVGHNVTLPHLAHIFNAGIVRGGTERTTTTRLLERLDVRPARPAVGTSKLSGGNQQKVLFAKWLVRRPRVLIADEPTRGVDVGAKRAIYDLIVSLAADGMGVLLISSEIEEILGLAHRTLVMRRGRIVGEFQGAEMSKERVMRAAFGSDSVTAAGG
jgi:ABC-type sugar transport system ATPase subunit